MQPTVFSVIDDFLDGREMQVIYEDERLDPGELLVRVHGFYSRWQPPSLGDGEVRVFPITDSSVIFTGFPAAAIDPPEMSVETQVERGYSTQLCSPDRAARFQRLYASAALYAHSVGALDPLTLIPFITSPSGGSSERRAALGRYEVGAVLMEMMQVRPLIEAGVLILVPGWKMRRTRLSDRHQVAMLDTALRPEELTEDAGALAYIEQSRSLLRGFPGYGLSMMQLALILREVRAADAIAATPVLGPGKWPLLCSFDEPPMAPADSDTRVVLALAALELPLPSQPSAHTLVKIRDEEDVFAGWQAQLRTVARTIRASSDSPDFADEARSAFNDYMLPQAAKVRRAVSRSRAIRDAVRDAPIEVGFSALVGTALSAAIGWGPELGAVTGAAGNIIGKGAAAAARPPSLQGPARVMMQLMR